MWSRNDTGEAFGLLNPLSGSRTATIGDRGVDFQFCRPILVVGRCIGFAVVMAPGETPGPFPNPEAKAWSRRWYCTREGVGE